MLSRSVWEAFPACPCSLQVQSEPFRSKGANEESGGLGNSCPPKPECNPVSLALCSPQSGMIRTEDADYFLKPVPPHLAGQASSSAEGGPPSHVLYKRSLAPAPRASQVLLSTSAWERPSPPSRSLHLGLPGKRHFCGRRKKCM